MMYSPHNPPDAWYGSDLAWVALSRLARGEPAFGRPARRAQQLAHRRAALEWLYEEGLLLRGSKTALPALTELGIEAVSKPERRKAYSARQLALIQSRCVPVSVLAARLGKSVSAIKKIRSKSRCQHVEQHEQAAG